MKALAVAYIIVYGFLEVFHTHLPSIRQQGLSSPYALVIPFTVMNTFNLLVNLLVPSYAVVTVLDPVDKTRRQISEKGVLHSHERLWLTS